MQDNEVHEFWFKITPTEIVPNNKPKVNTPKSLLVKLGTKQIKCKALNQSSDVIVQVLYSRTLKKYCGFKGIIKVYDVNADGSEIISCVGAFNTQELLSEKKKITKLERDIGPCKVYLTIEVQRKVDKFKQINEKNKSRQKQPDSPMKKLQQVSRLNPKLQNNNMRTLNRRFSKSPNVSESDCQEAPPFIIDDSSVDQADCLKSSNASEDFKLNESQIIGQQLVEQRRKIKLLEDKLQKSNIKVQMLRKTLSQKNNQMKTYYQSFRTFTAALESDSRGQYIFSMDQSKRQMSLKYKPNIKFKQIFSEFIAFIIKKMTENGGIVGSERTIQQQGEINKILTKLDNFQSDKKKQSQQVGKLKAEIIALRKELSQRSTQLQSKNDAIRKSQLQISRLHENINKFLTQKQDLEGEIQYLRQSHQQMQITLNSKQKSIENLQKIVSKANTQFYRLNEQIKSLKHEKQNFNLEKQQLIEQNCNLSEQIEGYRLKYGDLKQAKDKALQRQCKQYLRWVDQLNLQEAQLSLQDTTIASSESPSVTSFMKSIDQIEKMPQGQIEQIRKEVMSVLKRLDQLVSKNHKI